MIGLTWVLLLVFSALAAPLLVTHDPATLTQGDEDTRPSSRHGTYSFLFWDADDNAWEILSNPRGGYTWIFEQGDLSGKGHFERDFRLKRPDLQK